VVPDARPALSADQPAPPRRVLLIAGALALGILLSNSTHIAVGHSALALLAGAVVAALALSARTKWSLAAITLASLLLGLGWHTHRALEVPAHSLERLLSRDPTLITVEGTVLSTPDISDTPRGMFGPFLRADLSSFFRLHADTVITGGPAPATGTLSVRVTGALTDLRAGDRVRATGMAQGLYPPTNPGEPDTRPGARARGFVGRLSVDTPDLIEPLSPPSLRAHIEGTTRRAIDTLRLRAGAWLARTTADTPDQSGALLRALTLGETPPDLSEVRNTFTRLGLNHILAISGLHLALLAAAVAVVVRAVTSRPRAAAFAVIAVVLLYLLLVPGRAPIIRAALLVLAWTIGDAAGRRYDRVTLLGWAFVLVLIWNPTQLFDLGFQLSFGVVAALMLVAPRLHERLFGPPQENPDDTLRDWASDWSKRSISSALCAWGVATPWIAYRTGLFAPLGALATILLLPLASLVLALAYFATLLSLVSPTLARTAGVPVRVVTDWLIAAANALDTLPLSAVFLPSLSLPWAIGATAVIVWWMTAARWRDLNPRLATLIVTLWLGALLYLKPGLPTGTALRLDTIDVADGTCHLLRAGDEAALIDCGSLRLTIGERTIPQSVRALGAWRIPAVILSHPNIDHYCALPDIARPLGVRRVYLGEAFLQSAEADPLGAPAFLIERLRAQEIEILPLVAGDTLAIGPATLTVLSPPEGRTYRAANDASLVSLVTARTNAGDRTLLLTGDIQRETLVDLMTDLPDLRADLLEAPHHGSATVQAFEFVKQIDPTLVVQSTGPRRLNDERWNEARQGRQWLSTAAHGAVSAWFTRDGELHTKTWSAEPRSSP